MTSNQEFSKLNEQIVNQSKHPKKMYHSILSEMPRGRWFLEHMKPFSEQKILDLAGAHGSWGAYFMKVKKWRFNYTCVDRNRRFIEFAPKFFKELGLPPQTFICRDIKAVFPFPNDAFNQIWLFGWWRFFTKKEVETLFSKCNHVLKKAGFFSFDIPHEKTRGKDGVLKLNYSREQLEKLLEKTGFEIVVLESFKRLAYNRDKTPFIQHFHGVICKK